MVFFAWTDIETSGLSPDDDDLLEVACIVTEVSPGEIKEVARFRALTDGGVGWSNTKAFHKWRQDHWSTFINNMHEANGLVSDLEDAIAAGTLLTLNDLNNSFSAFLAGHNEGDPKSLYLAGSSVGFDKSWLQAWAPDMIQEVHYRVVDVSSTRVQLHALTGVDPVFPKAKGHRAMQDIEETINEFKFLWEKVGVFP